MFPVLICHIHPNSQQPQSKKPKRNSRSCHEVEIFNILVPAIDYISHDSPNISLTPRAVHITHKQSHLEIPLFPLLPFHDRMHHLHRGSCPIPAPRLEWGERGRKNERKRRGLWLATAAKGIAEPIWNRASTPLSAS